MDAGNSFIHVTEMKTSTLHLFQPSQHLSGLPDAWKQLCPPGSWMKMDFKNLLLHQQNAGKLLKTPRQYQVFYQLHHELNEEGAGLEQHNDQNTYSWIIMSILNHQGRKQYKYILQIVYCIQYIAFLKKLELCMLILALPSMERARAVKFEWLFFQSIQ